MIRASLHVEQLIQPGCWSIVERVAPDSLIPIMLDEGIASPADVEQFAALGRVLAHLKLVKLGGITQTLRVADVLSAAKAQFIVGQMIKGAVATAAALDVAHAGCPAYAELYGTDGLTNDAAEGLHYGSGSVGTGPTAGLGVKFHSARSKQLRPSMC